MSSRYGPRKSLKSGKTKTSSISTGTRISRKKCWDRIRGGLWSQHTRPESVHPDSFKSRW